MLHKSILATLISLTLSSAALAEEVKIHLNNGDVLSATVLDENADSVTIEHALLGQVTINKQAIESIDSATVVAEAPASEQQASSTEQQTAEEKLAAADTGLLGTHLLTGWERRFDLGLAGSGGKSRTQQINVAVTLNYADDETRIDSKTAYYRNESEGELRDSSFYSRINRDWLLPESPVFRFAGARADFDEFKDWDYRLSSNGGIGYEFINNEKWLFVGRTGLGFNQTIGGERNEFTPEGLLGLEARWAMNQYQRIQISNSLYPVLNDPAEFRNITSLDWTLDLNTYAGVALVVGVLNEYDTQTDADISKNDLRYNVSLAWKL